MTNNLFCEKELNEITLKNLKDYVPFFTVISGSHAYGFSSSDSDIDIRTAFLFDKESLFGFDSTKKTSITKTSVTKDDIEVDFVGHELRIFNKMIASGENGYALEQLFSPLCLHESIEFKNYKDTVHKFFITKKLYKHYSSFALNKFEELKNQKEKSLKTLLYIFRILYTGIYLFDTGEIKTNLNELNELILKQNYINDLILLKTSEKSIINDTKKIDFYENEIIGLLSKLEDSYNESSLPENIRNSYKLNRIVSAAYSKEVMKHEFIRPIPRSADDRAFIDKSKRKGLLDNSPFKSIEEALNIKLSPEKFVYLPHFKRYLHTRDSAPHGSYLELIDIDKFLLQLNKSNPFCTLAMVNADLETTNEQLSEYIKHPELLITKQLYKTFKLVSYGLYEKTLNALTYNSTDVIISLAILIYGTEAFKTGKFQVDFQEYMDQFKDIIEHKSSTSEIKNIFDDLSAKYEKAFENSNTEKDKPDKDKFEKLLRELKKDIWFS